MHTRLENLLSHKAHKHIQSYKQSNIVCRKRHSQIRLHQCFNYAVNVVFSWCYSNPLLCRTFQSVEDLFALEFKTSKSDGKMFTKTSKHHLVSSLFQRNLFESKKKPYTHSIDFMLNIVLLKKRQKSTS